MHSTLTQRPLDHVVVAIAGAPFHAFIDPDDGAVLAAGFATASDPEADTLRSRLAEVDPGSAARAVSAHLTRGGTVADALQRYAAGDLAAIDSLLVRQIGPPFRREVWNALRTVPAGKPVTYTELAALAGRPSAIRAAASGCATNLVALIVPCHRIVRRDGALGGYLFGTTIKAELLAHEARWAS